MNIDHTNLLKALKREESHDIPDAEKRRVAKEHHEWLRQIEEPDVQGSATLS